MGEAPVRGKRLSRANRAIDRTDDELAAIAGRARHGTDVLYVTKFRALYDQSTPGALPEPILPAI